MATFILADIRVENPEAYQEYVKQVPAIIARHGGIYRVRGGAHTRLEGDWEPNRLILLEFPDRKAAEAFYFDPDYEKLKQLRIANASSNLFLVEGLDSGQKIPS